MHRLSGVFGFLNRRWIGFTQMGRDEEESGCKKAK
jgi:hypothetical protein